MERNIAIALLLAWGAPLALALIASLLAMRVDPRLVALGTVTTVVIGYAAWIAFGA